MLTVTPPTLHRLLRRLAAQTSIPFHGEPVVGLQLMGILETRNLDFENILLLSTNEGIMPASGIELSFIPFAIRRRSACLRLRIVPPCMHIISSVFCSAHATLRLPIMRRPTDYAAARCHDL